MQATILCDIPDAQAIVNEERMSWTWDVLSALNVSKEIFEGKSIDAYRDSMNDLGIEVIYSTNGDVNIYKLTWHPASNSEGQGWLPATNDNLVAQWKEPTYIRVVEGDKVYYEIHLNAWSNVGRK